MERTKITSLTSRRCTWVQRVVRSCALALLFNAAVPSYLYAPLPFEDTRQALHDTLQTLRDGLSTRVELGDDIKKSIRGGLEALNKKFDRFTCGAAVTTGIVGTICLYHWIKRHYFKPKPESIISISSPVTLRSEFLALPPLEKTPAPVRSHGGTTEQSIPFHTLVKAVAHRTRAKKSRTLFPGLLLSGPSGSGKTTWAKRFAQATGYTLVLVSGAFLHNIAALDKLIQWVGKKKKHVIYIDGIETLCSNREKLSPTSPEYRLITHAQIKLKEVRRNNILIGATTAPNMLDPMALSQFSHTATFLNRKGPALP